MKRYKKAALFLLFICASGNFLFSEYAFAGDSRKRIIVVSSYHREYLWSQDTHMGVVEAFLNFKYLDNKRQGEEYTRNDYVESSRAVIKKLWMDTKRKYTEREIAGSVNTIVKEIKTFNPDILLLGDDNAANYVGNQYLDTKIPVVFWGINGLPLKYGLMDSTERPGHNVTGIYQAGYLKECVLYLKKLLPHIRTFAILSDDSETGRSKSKELVRLSEEGKLPVELIEKVTTNSFSLWKAKALELGNKVDAFFVFNHNTLKDDNGGSVDQLEAGAWYLRNIKKPDVGHEKQFVIEGLLAAVDDSGFKQGYEAVKMAYQILEKGVRPAHMRSYAPERGPFIVNRQRAAMLGIGKVIEKNTLIEEYIDKAYALEKYPE